MKVKKKLAGFSRTAQSTASAFPGKDRFDAAVRLHLAGSLDAALAGYDDVLAQCPAYTEAHHNAGTIRAQRGELDRAIAHLRLAISLRPTYAEAHHSLGLTLHLSGSLREAIPSFRRAVELNADSLDWWTDLAMALTAEGFLAEGLAANDQALALAPDNAQARANRAVPLRGLHRHQEAIEACRASLAVRPDNVDTLVNLGMVLREAGDFDGAQRSFDHALAIAPGHHKARANIVALRLQMNRHAEARVLAEQLIAEQPDSTDSWSLLGVCAQEASEYGLAEECQREALARSPDDYVVRWNIAQLTLLRGDFVEGFRQFEARKRLDIFMRSNHDAPEWNGEPLDGRTLLVHAEQGFGDSIHFVRFLPLLKARGAGRVILDECPPELAGLLRSAPGVDDLVLRGTPPPPFHVHNYLLSLPWLLGTTLETVPAEVPYLIAPERPIGSAIRAHGHGLRVGVVWGGNPAQHRDRMRSVGLEAMAPILATPGVTFFSLQKGEAVRQLERWSQTGIVNLDAAIGDFGDTAAAIAALDLVITVDTSVAHLAGALGKPVWVLLPHVACWRYLLDREDSVWYPTMRIFRQSAPNAWAAPVEATADALSRLSQERGASASYSAPHAVSAHVPAAHTAVAPRRPIEIDWPIGLTSGWGTYGLQLALALHRSSRAEPVLAAAPVLQGVSPLVERRVRTMMRAIPPERIADAIHLTALGNHVHGAPGARGSRSGRRAGVIFFEDTAFDAADRERAFDYDVIIAGSSWNVEMLKASGVPHVRLVLQGIDPSLFHPAPRTGVMGDRFLVFSGGKLEFRKGQDIVVEAFRRFHATHSDAVLVTAWHNHWPQTMADIDAMGYVRGHPAVRDGHCEISAWLVANGLAPDSVLDVGAQSQPVIAQVLREMDVAVFTNRCEGGTNLVAMEAMACGVPTILSANTGHLNLIGRDTCFPLERQAEVPVRTSAFQGTMLWGESDPDEVVALLERTYDDRAEARRRGTEGAILLAQLPWAAQAEKLLRQLDV
jgi:tetratricopeptide (TPR) repeat protein/glycosyltransferase involved in cell wall biosynthesis